MSHNLLRSSAVVAVVLATATLGVAPISAAAAPLGAVTEVSAGITQYAAPLDLTVGPDGNLWFTEARDNQIGRITPSGVVTEFPAGGSNARAFDITSGPDGNLWFSDYTTGSAA